MATRLAADPGMGTGGPYWAPIGGPDCTPFDSEFIYSQLVPVIRMAKERRQIIIVTHNPNIAVLGDAEQIVVLKATSERAHIIARGSIDDPAMKEVACAILPGAKAAFLSRRSKQGRRLNNGPSLDRTIRAATIKYPVAQRAIHSEMKAALPISTTLSTAG